MTGKKWILLLAALVAAGGAAWGLLQWRGRVREERRESAFAAAKPGEIVWRVKAGWTYAYGIDVCDDVVLCAGDSIWRKPRMRGFSLRTGREVWNRTTKNGCPIWIPHVGLTERITDGWTALDARTGRTNDFPWPVADGTYRILGLDAKTVCVCSYSQTAVYELGGPAKRDATLRWKKHWDVDSAQGIPSGMACFDGKRVIVACMKTLSALDAATGGTVWTVPLTGILHRPMCSRGRLYALSRVGNKEILEVRDTEAGALLWSKDTSGVFTVDDERVFVCEQDGVHCYGAVNGAEIWKVSMASAPYGCEVRDGMLYCGIRDQLVALDVKDGRSAWTCPLPPPTSWAAAFGEKCICVTGDASHLYCIKTAEGR